MLKYIDELKEKYNMFWFVTITPYGKDLEPNVPPFEKVIEDKAIAKQVAEKAKIETLRVEEEAKQMLLKAEAEGKALKLKSDALKNPLIVQYEVAKALGSWKGNLPSTLVIGQGALPILTGNGK